MKALYRKYRPRSLREVVGQEHITKPLAQAIKAGKFSHAYLFTGPRGCGKTSVARIFAHEVNQFKYELEDSYVDIIEIDAASNTGVDNIRELREKAVIAPTMGKYKVYIIDEVHMLSKSAFNALLKTLEEPPEHVIFVMATTDPEKVPVTIVSRAQVYQFSLATEEVMLGYLRKVAEQEKIAITDEALKMVVERGGGSFRDTLSLLDQISTLAEGEITGEVIRDALRLPPASLAEELLGAYGSGDLDIITARLREVMETGTDPLILTEQLVAKIVERPEARWLPLLAKLTEVGVPFVEAKLLLALSEGCSVGGEVSVSVPRGAVSGATVESEQVKSEGGESAKEEGESMKKGGGVSEGDVDNVGGEFSWEAFLDKVKVASASVYIRLKKCPHVFRDGVLHLYPEKAVDRSIFTHTNNYPILTGAVMPAKIVVHEIDEMMPDEKTSTFSKISAIMGRVQEVDNGGEIPF